MARMHSVKALLISMALNGFLDNVKIRMAKFRNLSRSSFSYIRRNPNDAKTMVDKTSRDS